MREGPIDMRMDPDAKLSAEDVSSRAAGRIWQCREAVQGGSGQLPAQPTAGLVAVGQGTLACTHVVMPSCGAFACHTCTGHQHMVRGRAGAHHQGVWRGEAVEGCGTQVGCLLFAGNIQVHARIEMHAQRPSSVSCA